jgi:hypothetical protein
MPRLFFLVGRVKGGIEVENTCLSLLHVELLFSKKPGRKSIDSYSVPTKPITVIAKLGSQSLC